MAELDHYVFSCGKCQITIIMVEILCLGENGSCHWKIKIWYKWMWTLLHKITIIINVLSEGSHIYLTGTHYSLPTKRRITQLLNDKNIITLHFFKLVGDGVRNNKNRRCNYYPWNRFFRFQGILRQMQDFWRQTSLKSWEKNLKFHSFHNRLKS